MSTRPGNIRRMRVEDLPVVLEIDRELFPDDPWSEAMFLGELADQPRTRHYVVVLDGDDVVGYAGLSAAGGEGDVQTIGVREPWQGKGLGAALLTELLEEAGRRGCQAVFLEVRADNEPAQKMYERFGFVRIGVRKRYYQPSGTDAIVMRRNA